MKKYRRWLFVPAFGILSVPLFIFAILIIGPDGQGSAISLLIIASPLAVLMMLGKGFIAVLLLVPFYWMGEAVLALCRNKYCKWAFLIAVTVKYIVIIFFTFFWNPSFQRGEEIDELLFLGTPYIGMQVLLWVLFLKTWDMWKPPWKKRPNQQK